MHLNDCLIGAYAGNFSLKGNLTLININVVLFLQYLGNVLATNGAKKTAVFTDFYRNPRDVNMTRHYIARSQFDWLVGMNATRAATLRLGDLYRIGRVKAPTLKLIYDNCAAVDSFVPSTVFQVRAIYEAGFIGILVDENREPVSWEKKEDELEAEAKKLEQKIKSLQTQYNKENAATGGGGAGTTTYNSGGTKTVGGVTWRWPTYCTSITSYYGYRIHPVYKTKKFHSGVDIGAGYGDTIMAAASGTVILVSEPVEGKNKGGTGYGNYCIIDHGNGYSTLYGHARDIYVKEGQKVSRGKAIGVVGSTGTSTGAHLHFEVRVNGSTTNPLNYLP